MRERTQSFSKRGIPIKERARKRKTEIERDQIQDVGPIHRIWTYLGHGGCSSINTIYSKCEDQSVPSIIHPTNFAIPIVKSFRSSIRVLETPPVLIDIGYSCDIRKADLSKTDKINSIVFTITTGYEPRLPWRPRGSVPRDCPSFAWRLPWRSSHSRLYNKTRVFFW